MEGMELPCDWTVNRRPTTTQQGAKTDHEEKKRKIQSISEVEEVDSSKTDEGKEETVMVTANPLGPRQHKKKEPLQMLLPNHGQIREMVLRNLCSTEEEPTTSATTMVVENLLSRLPYKKMLSDMFGGTLRCNMQTQTVPYVSRAYEESFMREAQSSGERECARGPHCECMFIDRTQPFVVVEFLLPGESMPSTPHLCVLCCRAITQQLYYDIMFDKVEFPGVIQRFGNIHSEPGEYALDAMLIAAPTAPMHIMPLPIVAHQRNRYLVYVQGGLKRLRQSRVYFQSTPSCSADSG